MADPLEDAAAALLDELGVRYERDDNVSGLDFKLLDYPVYVEVKQFHSERIADQMSRVRNVIVIQGTESLEVLRALFAAEKIAGAERVIGVLEDGAGGWLGKDFRDEVVSICRGVDPDEVRRRRAADD